MSELATVLAMIRSDQIAGNETIFIDKILSNSICDQIPASDVSVVIQYIDLHLAFNTIDEEVRRRLIVLYGELLLRQGSA